MEAVRIEKWQAMSAFQIFNTIFESVSCKLRIFFLIIFHLTHPIKIDELKPIFRPLPMFVNVERVYRVGHLRTMRFT